MTDDPFAVLGLDRTATVGELRSARRRLALELHPDRGGDERSMQSVNEAFEAAVAHATGRRPLPEAASPAAEGPVTQPSGRGRSTEGGSRPHVEHDMPSFVIEALPAEAFEALLVVAGWMGEVLVDEPPYLLETYLYEPRPCWCRLDLVPDAGSSTVSLTVAGLEGGPAPAVEDVRDAWVAQLNQL